VGVEASQLLGLRGESKDGTIFCQQAKHVSQGHEILSTTIDKIFLTDSPTPK